MSPINIDSIKDNYDEKNCGKGGWYYIHPQCHSFLDEYFYWWALILSGEMSKMASASARHWVIIDRRP